MNAISNSSEMSVGSDARELSVDDLEPVTGGLFTHIFRDAGLLPPPQAPRARSWCYWHPYAC